ncbi:DUF2804 family protein [Solirubrobacter sp. CPCC 204708]|uniref:DUF2804 domain-containing protein n=1 Tax=Solirubrobacter deserti TaxID=2282478 RepID=A0ABT4RFV1_9ACTN|nr:DUF2804 family protein [Solirubrobacter deserti]MBE2318134.1 DUF2804 family protein [Solirubrobacter deserti]MDA0137412.1 DUF2804 domain-containing protein [Solirubrobacter deserti]
MPLRKSWRWIGAFAPDMMLCVAQARVGLVRRSWWAVWDGKTLHEGTRAPFALQLDEGEPIEAETGPTWTRKTPLRVRGTVLGRELDAPGLLDESHGRHPRRTSWLWSAGAGVTTGGDAVVWNLVEGMHPGENTVWVNGTPHRVDPPRFDGIEGVADLRFTALATRAAKENYLVLASDYEQPFGTFTGSLPIAGELAQGFGVMERHEALW